MGLELAYLVVWSVEELLVRHILDPVRHWDKVEGIRCRYPVVVVEVESVAALLEMEHSSLVQFHRWYSNMAGLPHWDNQLVWLGVE